MLEKFEGWAENLGQSQITEDGDLIGERILSEDSYAGSTVPMVRMRQERMLSSEAHQLRNAN